MIFTPDELKSMGRRTVELIESSIEADDKETAKQLSQRMYREFLSLHDLYRDWVTALMSFIGRHYGDDVLHEAMKESVAVWIKPLLERYSGKSTRRKVELLAAGLRAHLQPFDIGEDDEKFTLSGRPCGSGGRLVLEGAYEPPRNFLRIQKPQPMTFNRPDFPVYCAHCFFQNTLPSELSNEALFITEPAAKLGEEPCRVYFYK